MNDVSSLGSARRRPAVVAAVTLVVFAVAVRMHFVLSRIPGYRGLYDRHPFYVPESLKSLLEITLAVIAVAALYRLGLVGTFRELGFRRPVARPVAAALLATLPMAAVFAITAGLGSELKVAEIAYLAVLSPLAEEVVFRGFAFHGLHRRAGWGFWPSVLVTALVFGLVHLEKGTSASDLIGIFLITGVGGALFAWLFTAWGDSLAAPFILHAAMNLCWQLFRVGDTAFAGWLPTALQVTTALLAIGLTLLLRPKARPAPS